MLSATIGIALAWQAWLAGRGINIPPFLACLLTAVAFTNVADLLKRGVDLETADLVGTVALRLFLAMSLMSLDLAAVFRAAGLILSAVVLQCIVTALIAVTLVRYAATRGAHGCAGGARRRGGRRRLHGLRPGCDAGGPVGDAAHHAAARRRAARLSGGDAGRLAGAGPDQRRRGAGHAELGRAP